ncbi:MAG: CBS domain-containing protein [Planctomycetia bacterium]|nr:CBS domain-containing protein [Planctomycetia bacterium]
MGTLGEILQAKADRPLLSVSQEATVLAATKLMNDHSVGCLVVTHAGRMVGIFTERDVLRRVVAACRAPTEVRVAEVMTRDVICCRPETTVDQARSLMKDRRVRHLPVVTEEGDVAGLVSIGDLNAYLTTTQEVTIHYLEEYLHGRS